MHMARSVQAKTV